MGGPHTSSRVIFVVGAEQDDLQSFLYDGPAVSATPAPTIAEAPRVAAATLHSAQAHLMLQQQMPLLPQRVRLTFAVVGIAATSSASDEERNGQLLRSDQFAARCGALVPGSLEESL
eukprot:6184895-Amphidinium_carterae.1